MAFKLKTMTATEATQRLGDNDPSFTRCDLSKNAVLQMKAGELIPKLAAALATNKHCQELILADCGLSDQNAAEIAGALKTNTTIVSLDLQENKIKDEGATALAQAIATNRTLIQLNLLNQKGSRFGDATLHAFGDMFDTNITLLKIIWRLESRQSFALNKKIVRNNDIDRRIKAGREYADLLPEKATPIPASLSSQRSESAAAIGLNTPRASDAPDSGRARGDTAPSSQRPSTEMLKASTPRAMPASYETPAPPPALPAAPTADPELEAKLKALDLEYEEAAAALKAEFAAKKLAIIEAQAS